MKYGALIITFIFGFITTFGTIFVFDCLFHTPSDDIENQMVMNSDVIPGSFTIPIRTFWHAYSFNDTDFMTEFDSKGIYNNKTFSKGDIAIVVLDVWNYNTTYNKVFYVRSINTTENITRLVDFARENNIPVIHTYNMYEPYITPQSGEFVVDARNTINDADEMENFLKCNKITSLFYTGYATNMCILFNPTGVIEMHSRGFKTYIMRDGTKALESNLTIENEFAKKISIRMIETQFEGSSTIVDFVKGYNAV